MTTVATVAGAVSESLCTACKNGEAAAGRHQLGHASVDWKGWIDEFRSVGQILTEILTQGTS